MKQAKYSVWYEWAKEHMDVKMIVKYFLDNHEVVQDYQYYIQHEEIHKNELVQKMVDAGFDNDDIEEIMLRYGAMI